MHASGSDCGTPQWSQLQKWSMKCWTVRGWGQSRGTPAVVMVVGAKYEISDSVTVELHASGEGLGSLCWGIRLSQSKPFHIIGQGHLLSSSSGEAFPTNATQLARSSILCSTTLKTHPHLSLFSPSFFFDIFFSILASSLWFYLSCSLHPAKPSTPPLLFLI